MSNTKETVVEMQAQENDGQGAKIVVPGSGSFVSPWTSDSTTLGDHTVVFEHNLDAIPTSITVLFSPDKVTAYPLLWSWSAGYSGNPVSVSLTVKTVAFSISAGSPLHGFWTPSSGWSTYSTGYWMVIASTTP
jgi:hypothetical protein